MYNQIYCYNCDVLIFDIKIEEDLIVKKIDFLCPHCQFKNSEEILGNYKLIPSKYIKIKEMERPDMNKEEYVLTLSKGEKWK